MSNNTVCCICFETNLFIKCKRCNEGTMCEKCFYKQIDYSDFLCPICRQILPQAVWYNRVNTCIIDNCFLGFWWMIGYVVLYYGCEINGIYLPVYHKYIMSWGCLLTGFITFHWLGLILQGSLTELDEAWIPPYRVHHITEQEFQETFTEYRRQHNSFCFVKKIVHFVSTYINAFFEYYDNHYFSEDSGKDIIPYYFKWYNIITMPIVIKVCMY